MRAIIIDDERHAIDNLSFEIESHCPNIEIVARCLSGKEGLLAIKKFKPDVIFLDVQMAYMNGFEMLDILEKIDFEIIFVTAYDEYAIDAINKNAFDFITKPVSGNLLAESVNKLEKVFLGKKEEQQKSEFGNIVNQKILLSTTNAYHFVKADDILYLKADGNYTFIFQESGKMILSKNLKELQKKLPSEIFFRCHNSFIINKNYISSYIKADGGRLIMTNGDEVKVSRNKKEELLNFFK